MKNKLLLGVGIAAGYVLGSRSGRAAYDKLKARAAGIWDSKPVQDKVAVATETIKEKAPEVADQLSEAARRAGTVIGSAMHREGAPGEKKSPTSDDATPAGASGTSAAGTSGGVGAAGTTGTRVAGTPGDDDLGEGHIPAHSTHPETQNLGTSDETDSKS
ncbi:MULTISPECIES: YtxH domain-containing protein [Pseudarthrobacter]|uniref:YtxH domain-containing protein n=1 Tax=Pseudarthrobacter polychromogenes TaxID=1676 RepID=A0ABQ1XIX3_9MICC|nr:YtxH domain-containing protein [Pseudarthrobacter polychromogenes]MBD1537822.1 YtxH domain-containing protein [Arthrobacter sp. S13_S34]GGG94854.1 hypothetical protein GCM10011577_17310 [Pseudarthrobacter polychromogenes]